MASIGIILNPFSGKDLRRLTTNASIVTNQEKVNKVFRMILSMNSFGIEKVWLMPDAFSVNDSVLAKMKSRPDLDIEVEVLDFEPYGTYLDTMHAAEEMAARGVGCIIALGGDGTSRLIARTNIDVPVISVSTGTNNAYPQAWEGTTAGIAAAFTALYPEMAIIGARDKSIKIVRNGEREEVAIVDAAINRLPNIGTKVVKDLDDIEQVITCISAPHLIGFSALVGSLVHNTQEDDFGHRIVLGEEGMRNMAPVNSGELTLFTYSELNKMELGETLHYNCSYEGSVALDGERTLLFSKGDTLAITIERQGLFQVDVEKTLLVALQEGFFKVENDGKNI